MNRFDHEEELLELGVASVETQGQGGASIDFDLTPAQQVGISDE